LNQKIRLKRGAYVFILDHNKKELELALSEIGRNVVGIERDVSNLADLDRLYYVVKDQKGHIDILFANAGNIHFAPLGKISGEDFNKIFSINVKGVAIISRGVMR
jgi:NAD(P)-dependent dehydrogenase (short-subunit alcohol dehydrogenase family)